MTKFKFFRGYVGTLNVMDGQTYATASLYDPHHGIITQQQYNLNRDMLPEQERVRRRLIDTNNQIRLFQTTTVTTMNPKWWMKIKMFFQHLLLYSDQVAGIAVIATTITFIVILIISKILNVW